MDSIDLAAAIGRQYRVIGSQKPKSEAVTDTVGLEAHANFLNLKDNDGVGRRS